MDKTTRCKQLQKIVFLSNTTHKSEIKSLDKSPDYVFMKKPIGVVMFSSIVMRPKAFTPVV